MALAACLQQPAQAEALRPGQRTECDPRLIDRLLEALNDEVGPAMRKTVQEGNKVFGAALLRKSDLSTIVVGTNHETLNPLNHAEVFTINKYYEMVNQDESKRVAPEDTIFLTTHEPCTLCLSAITWAGYDNYYYFFSHEDSRDSFKIGHDLKILLEVFKHEPGGYARENNYWTGYSIRDLIANCDTEKRADFDKRVQAFQTACAEMSEVYQSKKGDNLNIPLK